MLGYLKKTSKIFNDNFSISYNFAKKFFISNYWHVFDDSQRKFIFFNNKYKIYLDLII